MSENYTMKITPLTPIHIGTGKDIAPGEYFPLEQDGKHYLYAVNLGSIPMEEMGETRKLLLSYIDSNPIGWVTDVAREPRFIELIKKHARFRSRILDSVYNRISSTWGKSQNQSIISLCHRSHKGPYIPGSSIKGSIRTALLYSKIDIPIPDNKQPFEKEVFNWERGILTGDWGRVKIQDDILRFLKVSDTIPKGVITQTLSPVHVGMDAVFQDYKEALPGTSANAKYSLDGTLTIQTALLKKNSCSSLLSASKILDSCKVFYLKVLNAEKGYWEMKNVDLKKLALNAYAEIEKRANEEPDSALIRLGWGCGMNAIGLNMALPLESKHNDVYCHYEPITRILLGGCPPGWALLKLEKV